MSRGRPKDILNEIDMRLDGVLGELGQALNEAMARIAEDGGEVRRSQSIQTTKGPVRAEASIRVRMGGMTLGEAAGRGDPKPVIRPRKDAATTPEATPEGPSEITATIVTSGSTWSLTAELPGASESGLDVEVSDGTLRVTAQGARRSYVGAFDIPATIERKDLSITLRNGILDITADIGEPGQA